VKANHRYSDVSADQAFNLARPAGFEPATGCLEGSCSVRLSYGRPETSVADEDHASATYGSQCVATSGLTDSTVYEQSVDNSQTATLSRPGH
jgi:hypothetical protein